MIDLQLLYEEICLTMSDMNNLYDFIKSYDKSYDDPWDANIDRYEMYCMKIAAEKLGYELSEKIKTPMSACADINDCNRERCPYFYKCYLDYQTDLMALINDITRKNNYRDLPKKLLTELNIAKKFSKKCFEAMTMKIHQTEELSRYYEKRISDNGE